MNVVNKAHIKAFGSLTYHYAQVEVSFQKLLAGMLDIDPKVAIILAAPYRAVDLRNVVKSVAKELEWPDGALEKLIQIVGDSKPASQLRNHVAHSQWIAGTRPTSIKPIGLDIRQERARLYGHLDEERDWTAPEIEEVAGSLNALVTRIVIFAQETGLAANIARRASERKRRPTPASGHP
jgi:hypothetical protein